MGAEQNYVLSSIAPMSDEERWEGKVSYQKPADGWQKENFNDANWSTEKAAWEQKARTSATVALAVRVRISTFVARWN